MIERDEAGLVSAVAARPGAVTLALRSATDFAVAYAALRDAAEAVRRIPHPEEPDEPLPNQAGVRVADGVPVLHLDLRDHAGHAGQVVRAVLDSLDASGADGTLAPVGTAEPYDYDANADILSGTVWADPDARGLPVEFPPGFPAPAGTLVIVQRARRDTWAHAGWRADRPDDDYPTVLAGFGCVLEPVTARDRLMAATGMSRWLLRHPLGTGSVSTYHAYGKPAPWYVSVAWRPLDAP